jgi:hypothetical protein
VGDHHEAALTGLDAALGADLHLRRRRAAVNFHVALKIENRFARRHSARQLSEP